MSDDIVTRLRDIAFLCHSMGETVIRFACTDAADEIERLRMELQKQPEYILSINAVEGKNWNPKRVAEIISKAVRGE